LRKGGSKKRKGVLDGLFKSYRGAINLAVSANARVRGLMMQKGFRNGNQNIVRGPDFRRKPGHCPGQCGAKKREPTCNSQIAIGQKRISGGRGRIDSNDGGKGGGFR